MVAILEEEVLKEPIRDRGMTREGRGRCRSGPIRVLWCPEKRGHSEGSEQGKGNSAT